VERFLQFQWWVPAEWAAIWAAIGPLVGRALILGLLTWYLARAARSSFEHATSRTGADPHFRLLIGRLVSLVILAIGGITVLDTIGVPLSTLVAVVGVAGIGIGLALQDLLKNFFAGTYLLFERPFRIGEEIAVKDHRGRVETIGVRTTTLRTADNVQILIPNAMVIGEVVSNRTYARAAERELEETTEEASVAAVPSEPENRPAEPMRGPRLSGVVALVSHGRSLGWMSVVKVAARQVWTRVVFHP
jgi:small-conductance mechanosensitive channel